MPSGIGIMIGRTTIHTLDVAGETAWDGYVSRHSAASIYHLSAWRTLIADLYGHASHYLYATEGADVVGVLPMVRLKSVLFGDYLVSMPYFNYGGAVAQTPEVKRQLLEQAAEFAARNGCSHIEARDTAPFEAGWAARTDKVGMELALPRDVDALWSGFSSKLRAQIKRPQREPGVEVRRGGAELLSDFYQVFSRNMRDLGTPVYPVTMFARILAAFPATTAIVSVRFENQPVAAGFVIGFRDRLEIPWAASLREFNRFGFNMLLYWEILKKAVEDGYAVFDFGRSSRDGGTHKFKQQWGAQERPLYWHYWLAAGKQMPNLTPKNSKYSVAIALWKRIPLPVANRIGPWLVGNLP